MRFVLGYQNSDSAFTFTGCAMFGAIVSATDPVAVVALLKSLGVSKQISTLIEGESLLNDGTAMVVFLILKVFTINEITGEENPGVGEIIWMFVRMSLIASLLGATTGWFMALWLNKVHNNPVLEANLTVCVPYILFYVCEYLGMSGILGIVSCGLYMANAGNT